MFFALMPAVASAIAFAQVQTLTATNPSGTTYVQQFRCPPSGWYDTSFFVAALSATNNSAVWCDFSNPASSAQLYPSSFAERPSRLTVLSGLGTANAAPAIARSVLELNQTAKCSISCQLNTGPAVKSIVVQLNLNRVHSSGEHGQDVIGRSGGVAKKGDGPPGSSQPATGQVAKSAQKAAPGKPRTMRLPPARAPVPKKASPAKTDLSIRDVLGAVDRLEKVVGPIAQAVAPEYATPIRAAYKTGRAVVDAVFPEHAPHEKNQRVVAPVAYGTRIKRGAAHFSKGQMPGSLVVSHTEYLTDISGSNGAINIATVDLNPGVFNAFPWLSSIARRFETYRFRRLQYKYKQTTTTGESGVVALASCWNVNDPVPTTKDEIMNFEGTVKSSPWVDLTFNCLHANLKQRSTYFVRTGPVVPPENDTSRGGADNRDVDYNMYDTARLITLVEDLTTGVIGELYVEYEIEFMSPIVEFSPDISCTFSRPNDTTTIGCGAMTRDAHSSFLVELTQPITNVDRFDFNQAFEGTVTVCLVQSVGVGSQVLIDTNDCILSPESGSTPGFVPQSWSQATTLTVPVMATFAIKTTGPAPSIQLAYTSTAAAGSVLAEPYATAWVTFSSNNTTPFFDPATTTLDVEALRCLIAENKRFRFTTSANSCTMTHEQAMARIRAKPTPDNSASTSTSAARHMPTF